MVELSFVMVELISVQKTLLLQEIRGRREREQKVCVALQPLHPEAWRAYVADYSGEDIAATLASPPTRVSPRRVEMEGDARRYTPRGEGKSLLEGACVEALAEGVRSTPTASP